MQVRNLGGWGAQMASPNPLDSRFRGNDGVKIGSNSAIIASLRPLRLRAFASNSLCQHALALSHKGRTASRERGRPARRAARKRGSPSPSPLLPRHSRESGNPTGSRARASSFCLLAAVASVRASAGGTPALPGMPLPRHSPSSHPVIRAPPPAGRPRSFLPPPIPILAKTRGFRKSLISLDTLYPPPSPTCYN